MWPTFQLLLAKGCTTSTTSNNETHRHIGHGLSQPATWSCTRYLVAWHATLSGLRVDYFLIQKYYAVYLLYTPSEDTPSP